LVLGKAIQGVYCNKDLANLTFNWRKNYFDPINEEQSSVIQKLKNEVIFRKFNLNNEVFPFKKKFHVIFCRNVMIYFDAKTKKELINRFYECTEYGGYLFIGHSESLNNDMTRYKYIAPSIYRRE